MNREFWLDGFNFFYQWESTRGLFGQDSGIDIVRAIDRALRILGRHLGPRSRYTVIYLDGGLSREESRYGPLRIRHSGPGRKADDRMADDLADLADFANLVTAVSNDRELKSRLKMTGATCLGVGEFLAAIEGPRPQKGKVPGKGGKPTRSGGQSRAMDDAAIMREKCRSLSPSEVDAWLDFFGGEEEGNGTGDREV